METITATSPIVTSGKVNLSLEIQLAPLRVGTRHLYKFVQAKLIYNFRDNNIEAFQYRIVNGMKFFVEYEPDLPENFSPHVHYYPDNTNGLEQNIQKDIPDKYLYLNNNFSSAVNTSGYAVFAVNLSDDNLFSYSEIHTSGKLKVNFKIPEIEIQYTDGAAHPLNSTDLTTTFTIDFPALDSYAIKYFANAENVVNIPNQQRKWADEDLILSSTTPTREGYHFTKWNTAADGSGTYYEAGATYTENKNLTLYAQWLIKKYTISFDNNGGSDGPTMQTKNYGTDLILSSVKPTKEGYTFVKWNTSVDGRGTSYNPGDTYTKNESLSLHAIWEEDTSDSYTIYFDPNFPDYDIETSGTMTPQVVKVGETVPLKPNAFTAECWKFLCWKNLIDDAIFHNRKPIKDLCEKDGSITLTAQWQNTRKDASISCNIINRCNKNGDFDKFGEYIHIKGEATIPVDTNGTRKGGKGYFFINDAERQTQKTSLVQTFSTNVYSFNTIFHLDTFVSRAQLINICIIDWSGRITNCTIGSIPSFPFPIDIKKQGKGIGLNAEAESAAIICGLKTIFTNNAVIRDNISNGKQTVKYIGSSSRLSDLGTPIERLDIYGCNTFPDILPDPPYILFHSPDINGVPQIKMQL